jgi:hypothetical protein
VVPASLLEVFTEKKLSTAVEAFVTQLGIICNNPLADCKPFHILSDSSDDSDSLVARNKRELQGWLVMDQGGSVDPIPLQ